MVYSYVTGKEREVRTLSGGESFMAALSLALGMADQIQERAASVNLDMMFIDEGFGSLDDHSRDAAIRVLRNMGGGLPAHRHHLPCDGIEAGDRGSAACYPGRGGKPCQMADQLSFRQLVGLFPVYLAACWRLCRLCMSGW